MRIFFRTFTTTRFLLAELEPITSTQPKVSKFWKETSIAPSLKDKSSFTVFLDKRPLKSPGGSSLEFKSEFIAKLVQFEWETQGTVLKTSSTLPLTSIYVRAIDSFSKDPKVRIGVIDNLLKYLKTDTILFQQNEEFYLQKVPIQEKQKEFWDPIIKWANEKYSISIEKTTDLALVKQSDEVYSALRAVVSNLDELQLAAFEKAVLNTKSFLTALALINGHVTVEEAAYISRLEVLHQIERWGEVEDSHDVDGVEIKRQLGAVSCLFAISPIKK